MSARRMRRSPDEPSPLISVRARVIRCVLWGVFAEGASIHANHTTDMPLVCTCLRVTGTLARGRGGKKGKEGVVFGAGRLWGVMRSVLLKGLLTPVRSSEWWAFRRLATWVVRILPHELESRWHVHLSVLNFPFYYPDP